MGTCGDVLVLLVELDRVYFDVGFSFGEDVVDLDVGVGDGFDSGLRWGY